MAYSKPSYSVGSPLQNVFPSPVVSNRAPTSNDLKYEIGQTWVNKSSNQAYILTSSASGAATWSIASPGASDVDTLTADSGGALSPAAGNITIAGGTGITTSGSGSTITVNAAAGQQPITQYVVDGSGGGDYTTVQAALDAIGAAGSGQVWVKVGTYTENLVFPAGINVTLMTGADEDAGAPEIVGVHTPPSTGNVIFWRIKLTSATHIFNSGAAGTADLVLAHNNYDVNGYLFNCPNWVTGGSFTVWNAADRASTSSGIVNNTGGADVFLFMSTLGVGAGNALITSGTVEIQACSINCPVTFGSGTVLLAYISNFSAEITLSGTATGSIHHTSHSTGAAPCITMSSSAAVSLFNSTLLSTNDPALDGAGAGTITLESVSFLSNSNVAATLTTARGATRGGTSFATTFDTDVAAAGVTLSGTTLAADGTDANISITATPKGTGTLTVDSGGVSVTAGDVVVASSSAGADVNVQATNSDNTNAASRGGFEAAVGGTSAGDPYLNFLISGGQTYTVGIDNSTTNDDFVISNNVALGTSNALSIDGSTNDVSVLNNMAVATAGKQLQVKGGAATDFIGQATLVAGTVTVANTNIAAGDRIFVTRSSVNSSTALGEFVTSISAATSFTITAVQAGTPASAETNDVSIVDYFIVRSI